MIVGKDHHLKSHQKADSFVSDRLQVRFTQPLKRYAIRVGMVRHRNKKGHDPNGAWPLLVVVKF
jgi:hypothetical protein